MLRGTLITQSLRLGAELRIPNLRVTRIAHHDVSGSATAKQPPIWTFVDFEAVDDDADELATQLAEALSPENGWYADFRVADDHVVVFSGKAFRYSRGDDAGRRRAVDHGLASGTPPHQLDWTD